MIPPKPKKGQSNKHRRALLAKVHIAKKELDITDEDYRDILADEFKGARSAADLTNLELVSLLRWFEEKGWKARGQESGVRSQKKQKTRTQAQALKEKARGMLDEAVENGWVFEPRGLVRKICGVDELEWCGDAVRLKSLLAVLAGIAEKAYESKQ